MNPRRLTVLTIFYSGAKIVLLLASSTASPQLKAHLPASHKLPKHSSRSTLSQLCLLLPAPLVDSSKPAQVVGPPTWHLPDSSQCTPRKAAGLVSR
jgi:hypothetical protein